MWASKLAWFLWRSAKSTWFQRGGSNLTWFQCTDEIDMVVVRVVENDLIFVSEIRIDLVFGVRAENHSLLEWASKLTWFCVGGRNWHDVRVGDRTWLDFSVGMKLIRLLYGLSKLTWFQGRDRKWLVFCVAIKTDLISSEWVETSSIFVSGRRKSTWY